MDGTIEKRDGNKLANYLRESKAELQKVVWPTKRETVNYTLLVVAISVGVALFIGVIDFVLTLGVENILK